MDGIGSGPTGSGVDRDRDSDFDIAKRRSEADGRLANGNRFHVTCERIEIRDASGAMIQTIPASEIAATRRVNSTVTLTRTTGETIELVATRRDDAAALNGIFGSDPTIKGSYVDNPLAGNRRMTFALLGVIAFVFLCILGVLATMLLAM